MTRRNNCITLLWGSSIIFLNINHIHNGYVKKSAGCVDMSVGYGVSPFTSFMTSYVPEMTINHNTTQLIFVFPVFFIYFPSKTVQKGENINMGCMPLVRDHTQR